MQVHHGGAGTTATGLRAGVIFFIDQNTTLVIIFQLKVSMVSIMSLNFTSN